MKEFELGKFANCSGKDQFSVLKFCFADLNALVKFSCDSLRDSSSFSASIACICVLRLKSSRDEIREFALRNKELRNICFDISYFSLEISRVRSLGLVRALPRNPGDCPVRPGVSPGAYLASFLKI